MKIATRFASIALVAGLACTTPALAAGNAAKDAKAQTMVTEDDARKTALASVPNGTVQNAKLVNDEGRQVWAFDLKSATSTNVFKVQVDASSGRIVSKSVERPAAVPKTEKAKP
jgi:uncharacterized membrane protein YkoI